MTQRESQNTKRRVSATKHRPHWLDRFLDGWAIYRKNIIGRIGLALLAVFALMALASFLPQLVNRLPVVFDPFIKEVAPVLQNSEISIFIFIRTDNFDLHV